MDDTELLKFVNDWHNTEVSNYLEAQLKARDLAKAEADQLGARLKSQANLNEQVSEELEASRTALEALRATTVHSMGKLASGFHNAALGHVDAAEGVIREAVVAVDCNPGDVHRGALEAIKGLHDRLEEHNRVLGLIRGLKSTMAALSESAK